MQTPSNAVPPQICCPHLCSSGAQGYDAICWLKASSLSGSRTIAASLASAEGHTCMQFKMSQSRYVRLGSRRDAAVTNRQSGSRRVDFQVGVRSMDLPANMASFHRPTLFLFSRENCSRGSHWQALPEAASSPVNEASLTRNRKSNVHGLVFA